MFNYKLKKRKKKGKTIFNPKKKKRREGGLVKSNTCTKFGTSQPLTFDFRVAEDGTEVVICGWKIII